MVYSLNGLGHNEIIWPSTKYFYTQQIHNRFDSSSLQLLVSCSAFISDIYNMSSESYTIGRWENINIFVCKCFADCSFDLYSWKMEEMGHNDRAFVTSKILAFKKNFIFLFFRYTEPLQYLETKSGASSNTKELRLGCWTSTLSIGWMVAVFYTSVLWKYPN